MKTAYISHTTYIKIALQLFNIYKCTTDNIVRHHFYFNQTSHPAESAYWDCWTWWKYRWCKIKTTFSKYQRV